MEELRVPAELKCDHPDFDPDAESWTCGACRHVWDLAWCNNELEHQPIRPSGFVNPEAACESCKRRLSDFFRKTGGVRRRPVGRTYGPSPRSGAAGGGLQPGVNVD